MHSELKPRQAKMGGNRSISVFLQGSEDLVDSLLAIGEGGGKLTEGLRQRVTEAYGARFEVEIFHEPSTPSEVLLSQSSSPSQPSFSASSEGSLSLMDLAPATRLFQQAWDVVVFSLQPEITRPLWRHKKHGFRVSPHPGWQCEWSSDQRRSFSEQYERQGLVPVEQFRQQFARLVAEIKQRLAAHIIVFNCCTYDPDDRTSSYFGVQDTPALRALKFNLALIDLSAEEGISIVDVDRVLAELGGGSHVTEAFRYSSDACKLIRDEFLRILQDIGFFERRPLVEQVGRKRA
jgi:hypothetical protein